MSISWHSWRFWSHTAGTYFWFCHADISPAVPVRQESPASTKCVAEGQGRRGGKGENEPGIILCILSSSELKSCFSFSSPILGALSTSCLEFSGRRTELEFSTHAVLCSQVVRVKPRTLQKRGRKEMGWAILWDNLFCFIRKTRVKMFLCPIFPVHTLAGGEQGYGVMHSLFFSLFMYSLVLFLPLLVVQTRYQARYKIHHHLPFLPLEKIHLPKCCGALTLVLPWWEALCVWYTGRVKHVWTLG